MKKVDRLSITVSGIDGYNPDQLSFDGPLAFEQACSWLLGHGVYDKIEFTRTFTVEKEVAERLKGQ